MKNHSHSRSVFTATTAAAVLCGFLLPLLTLFSQAFTTDGGGWAGFEYWKTYFSSPHLVSALTNSLFTASAATVCALIPAFAAAWALTRSAMPGKAVFRHLFMLPLLAPTMMHAIALIYLAGRQGILTRAGMQVELYGPPGVILAETIAIFPLMLLILMLGFANSDRRLYEAAELFGCSRLEQFLCVTLPAMRNAVLSALLVGFTFAFTDFGAPKVIGGQYNILAVDLYKSVIGGQDFHLGAVAAILLALPAAVAFRLEHRLRSAHSGQQSSHSTPLRVQPEFRRDLAAFLLCLAPALFLGVLFVCMAIAAFSEFWPYDLTFTLRHFDFAPVMAYSGWEVLGNSLLVAALTAIAGVTAAFLAAALVARSRAPEMVRKTLHQCFQLPMAIPGLALGVAFILFFNRSENPLHFLYGTAAILVLANVVHFFPVPYLTGKAALEKLDCELENAADCCGVSRFTLYRRVVLPLLLPVLVENTIYFMLNAMITVSAVVFLYPADFPIGSVAVINMEDAGEIAAAAALSLLIILINLLICLGGELTLYLINRHRKHKLNQTIP